MSRYVLDEEYLPKKWYNIIPDLPEKIPPPLNPATKEPIKPHELEPVFPKSLIRQEMSEERWIRIPEEVLEIYRLYRPTPLIRAERLEKALKTPAKIFYKYEGVSPPGSHKPNTAIAQAYYNMKEGVEMLTTETGAGQWGSALAFATNLFGLKCRVYMVKASYEQKPYRRVLMETWKAEVIPSPSKLTESGRRILEKDPNCPGSLGIAISEAVETAVKSENTKYSLGSVLNHVLLHQTIVGLEVKKQLELLDLKPDYLIGCVGGGSNYAGFSYPFVKDAAKDGIELIAVEPRACPTLTSGEYRYDFGDTAGLTPLLMMYTLGHDFIPPPIHAGGLRYHGMAPSLCILVKNGIMKPVALGQLEVFEAGVLFSRAEGIVPAPESAHAVKVAIDKALEAKRAGEEKIIVFNLSGHGYFDLKAYEEYLKGTLPDT
ncbi:MAG: TrpB-like pyridoxal phosphate-dependent enzyme [Archaeoglobales archaeon]|jgi:tryptophan synthase beta chain|nr:TrpB-like pyridoxal phosphate-dependent enzyme [Archaeoglobi archaeon]NHW23327.1 TrpB-like pyridoxal phosphate-dependent enzyme [Archaeoglobales archaeon]TDA25621.1 MAG: TrpB-like pyridoxal phosphate-dependent enzyme [Archaeoglobi archaeon]